MTVEPFPYVTIGRRTPRSPAAPARRPSFSLPAGKVLRVELLAGLVVALALIPEAISFSIIAGVEPKIGLYASFTMAVAISIVAGVIQIALGAMGVAKLMRFVPQAVMTGFVNALAILIFLSQVDHLTGDGALGWAFVVVGLAIILLLPRVVPQVPSPLVALAILTAVVVAGGIDITNVGDEGELPSTIPLLGIPSVPFSLETLTIVLPFAATLAAVGLIESLMTARLVDDITDTSSDKGRESRGQGIANVVTGFFGGMPGCAMIGQTMINVRVSGARTRLSTFSAGAFLLIMCVALGDVVAVIPMTALVAVMIFVSYATFDWHSIRPATLRRLPRGETLVMVLTVVPTVATDNLAIGVGVGVLASMALFARRVAHLLDVERTVAPDGTSVLYRVRGELFFASNEELTDAFHHPDDPAHVLVDMREAHVWDASAVSALDALAHKYEQQGKTVEITGLNRPSSDLHEALSGRGATAH